MNNNQCYGNKWNVENPILCTECKVKNSCYRETRKKQNKIRGK